MEELSPVEALLPSEVHESVQVTLESLVTETGMLELWFVARDGGTWGSILRYEVQSSALKLFPVRGATTGG